METYRIKKGDRINYQKMDDALRSVGEEVVLAQWLRGRPGIPQSVPEIFIGQIHGVDLDPWRHECDVSGVGAYMEISRGDIMAPTGRYFIPAKKEALRQGVARVVDSRRNIIYEDERLTKAWNNAARAWLRAVHKRPPNLSRSRIYRRV